MKEKLLHLLNTHPATAGRSNDFLDTLAEDIQAVIIRAIAPAPYDEAAAELEYRVSSLMNDVFGASLYNLYVMQDDFVDGRPLTKAARESVVAAMLQTMLVEQDTRAEADRMSCYSESGEQGETLKRRLTDTALQMSSTIH